MHGLEQFRAVLFNLVQLFVAECSEFDLGRGGGGGATGQLVEQTVQSQHVILAEQYWRLSVSAQFNRPVGDYIQTAGVNIVLPKQDLARIQNDFSHATSQFPERVRRQLVERFKGLPHGRGVFGGAVHRCISSV